MDPPPCPPKPSPAPAPSLRLRMVVPRRAAVRNPKLKPKPKALGEMKAEAQHGWPSARSPGQRQRVPAVLRMPPPAISGGEGEGEGDGPSLPCDILLALRFLVWREAAAVCPPPGDGEDEDAATAFVLFPMLRAALLSTVPSAPSVSVSASADETNRLLEAGAATGSAEELSRLRRAGNVRVLRLHGTRAEGGEEDLAAMESPDYCGAVRDAFALGRRMEARMAARREVQTQVQQQAQEEGAIDRLERWYLFQLAAWARTFVTRADLRRALPPSASAGLLHRHQHHHRLPSPPPPPAVAVPPVDRIADRLVALGLLLPRSGEVGAAASAQKTTEGRRTGSPCQVWGGLPRRSWRDAVRSWPSCVGQTTGSCAGRRSRRGKRGGG